jgi:hypothetical protein
VATQNVRPDPETTTTSADATVEVLSQNGGVGVIAFGGIASIDALALGATTNNAETTVHAKGTPPSEKPDLAVVPGRVTVFSRDGFAGILALAAGGEGSTNTARTAVAARDVVVANMDCGIALIGSAAVGETALNTATTEIYAGGGEVGTDVIVSGDGAVIGALTIDTTDGWDLDWDFIADGFEDDTEGSATLIIDSYGKRKDVLEDCPDCPGCPCEEEPPPPTPAPTPLFAPPAPLYHEAGQPAEEIEFAEGGCPVLMAWLADELGVDEDIQVYIENAFAYSTDIQPCDMCARLMNSAGVLDDVDGARIAALAMVVDEFVEVPGPPSEEQMTLIAASFSEHVGDGTHYASAGEYLDALVAYVAILNTELGWTTADSVALVMEKHGGPATESGNAALVAYIEARLAALGG